MPRETYEGMSTNTKEVATGALKRVIGMHITGGEEMTLLFVSSGGLSIVRMRPQSALSPVWNCG